MSYKSHRIGPDRVFDHLYDPLFITSGTKDIWKENHNALYRSAPVRIYPQYQTMFTDLPRRPRNYYIQQRNPLPHFPFVDEQGNQSNAQIERKCRTATVIGGRDRAKFFNIPLNNEMNMNLQLDIRNDHVCCGGQQSFTPREAFRTVGCETIYREQSAQTKPWMPDHIVDEKCTETPELLYAAKNVTSSTVPGIVEAKQIQRARRRRALEKAFSQSKYSNDWNKRREFYAALEWEDRVGRETELEYCQQLRLGMVKKMMDSRENKMQKAFSRQMETTVNRLSADKERKLNTLRINHQRTLRRLDKQFGEKSNRSKALAPERQQTTFVSYSTDFEARLEDLHKMPTMPTNLERFTQPKVDITKPKQPTKEVKKGLWTEKFLINLYDSLKVIQKKIVHQRTAKCLIDIREEVLSYVSTAEPSIDSYPNESDYQHAVFLQKLMKGRAIQSILHDGKDANQELIDQLKETFVLESVVKAECAGDWNEENLMEYLGQYIDQEYARYAEQKEIYDRQMFAESERQRGEEEKEREIRKEQQEVAADGLDRVLTVFDVVQPIVDMLIMLPKQEDDHPNPIRDLSLLNDDSSQIIVDDVINNLMLPKIYQTLYPDEQLLDGPLSDNLVSDQQNEQNQMITVTEEVVTAEHQSEEQPHSENLDPQNDQNRFMSVSQVEEIQEIVADAIEHVLQQVITRPAVEVTNDIIDGIVQKTIELTSSCTQLSADSLDKEIGGMLDDLCDQLLSNLDVNDDTDESGSDCP